MQNKFIVKFPPFHIYFYQIQKYLSAMGVEYKTNQQIGNYELPLVIPAKLNFFDHFYLTILLRNLLQQTNSQSKWIK